LVNEPKFKRILVVINPDKVQSGQTDGSALLTRALSVAKANNAELELFHACYDPSIAYKSSAIDSALSAEKANIADRYATRLAELTLGMDTEGISIRQDVRWDAPQTDAILRKITDYRPDVVMKRAGDHAYFFGLVTNTDWELVRRSPAHVWFVQDNTIDVDTIVTAIGTMSDEDEIISATDYDVFRAACLVADAFAAKNFAVHAFQAPHGTQVDAMYGPMIGGMSSYPDYQGELDETRQAIAQQHNEQIKAFVEYFHLDTDNVRLEQGRPSDVIPRVAESLNAGLIVMGARNLGRWQQMLGPVTAEPVLADAGRDVLFVKEPSGLEVPAADEPRIQGSKALDLEAAITHPELVFATPGDVASEKAISVELRRRILQAWDHDIRAQMLEEDEGGVSEPVDLDKLGQIAKAQESLSVRIEREQRLPDTTARLRDALG